MLEHIDKKIESDSIYWIKIVAILFTIFAHVVNNSTLGKVFGIVGTFGVPLFLVISGYFLSNKNRPLEFWKKKTMTIELQS